MLCPFHKPFCFAVLAVIARPAELPVKNIVLYKHGIGYFERAGIVPSGEDARLDFKNGDMNDVLKSLTVTDREGRHVSGIRYDSNATIEQQLQDFPFQIEAGEKLSAFLDRFRGARLEIKTKDGAQAGSIVSARALQAGTTANPTAFDEQVTLLLDSGEMQNFELAQINSLRLTDAAMQQKLKDYLRVISNAKARDKRSVYIDSVGEGARDLKVNYIAPVAIWKSSYRLTLADAKSSLEGWAIVDNTTDEDWNNVGLAVVSGRPISFISLLDQPRFGNRQVADLPDDHAAKPEIYGGAIASAKALPMNGRGVMGGVAGLAPAPPPQAAQSLDSETVTVSDTKSEALGELFEYSFATPVTIKRNQSAMLPFLQDKIAARKLLIYKSDQGEHPVNAAELTNTSGKTLDGGPITVYDGGAYAGEALVETFKAGDKRLIGYAVDYGMRVTTAFDGGDSSVLEVHANNGTLEIKSAEHQTVSYEVQNIDSKPKTLIIQQDIETGDQSFRVISPKPTERTANANRFEIHLAANAAQTLKVERERVTSETTVVSTANSRDLVEIVSGRKLSEAGRTQLQAIISLKSRVASAQASLDGSKSSIDELTQDQTRLRQNIDSLNKVSGQEDKVRQYSSRLNDNEVKLAEIRDKRNELKQNLSSLNAELTAAIAKLQF